MKSEENEKKENSVFYAKNFCSGKFAGAFQTHTYECLRCHRRKRASLGAPRCPSCNCMMVRVD